MKAFSVLDKQVTTQLKCSTGRYFGNNSNEKNLLQQQWLRRLLSDAMTEILQIDTLLPIQPFAREVTLSVTPHIWLLRSQLVTAAYMAPCHPE